MEKQTGLQMTTPINSVLQLIQKIKVGINKEDFFDMNKLFEVINEADKPIVKRLLTDVSTSILDAQTNVLNKHLEFEKDYTKLLQLEAKQSVLSEIMISVHELDPNKQPLIVRIGMMLDEIQAELNTIKVISLNQ